MDRQKQYWVVSSNVTGRSDKKYLEDWRKLIREQQVAILGWRPDTDEKESPRGKKMGERFAGIGNPPVVQRGDVILIARGHKYIDVVAVGMVENDEPMTDGSPWVKERHYNRPVQKRKLKYFTPLEKSNWKSVEAGLKKALGGNVALKGPLDVREPNIKMLCRWLDRQLEDASKKLEANIEGVKRGGSREETEEHRRLKYWCAKNPEELGLSDAISSQTVIDQPLHLRIPDAPDVVFKRQGHRWAVVEVETSNAYPGAYQALKYKTLLCGREGYPVTSDRVRAILVAWQIPAEVRDFCEKYHIDWQEKQL